jgi:nuclear transport factor 2 (NTF2) superfamily protein
MLFITAAFTDVYVPGLTAAVPLLPGDTTTAPREAGQDQGKPLVGRTRFDEPVGTPGVSDPVSLPLFADTHPPLPPFTLTTALVKVQGAEDAWNSRDADRVSLVYTADTVWRDRDNLLTGRDAVVEFLTAKWERELDYALRKNLWAFHENRIAVRFQYEWRDVSSQWHRSYGNELWEFDDHGLMRRREASINDIPIAAADRRYFGPRTPQELGGPEIPLQ